MDEERPRARVAVAVVLATVAVSVIAGIWLSNAFTRPEPTVTEDEATRIAVDYANHHTAMNPGPGTPYTVAFVEYEPDGWYANRMPNGTVTPRHQAPCSGGGFLMLGNRCGGPEWYVQVQASTGGRVWWEDILVDATSGRATMGGGGAGMPSNLVAPPHG